MKPSTAAERRALAAQRQAAARAAYRASVTAGTPLTGAEVGRQFDRSERWGRDRIIECRRADSHVTVGRGSRPAAAATGNKDHGSAAAAGRQADRGGGNGPAAAGPFPVADRDGPVPGAGHPDAARGRASVRAQRVDSVIVAVVALVAAVASYEHQRTLAVLAGEGDLAYVLPISVDGMMLATSRSILRRRRSGLAVPALSWFGFLLGFAGSVAANVAAAEPTLVGRLVAAWPPVALFIAYETLAADHGDRSGP